MNDNNYIDADFSNIDDNENKIINGEPKYFSISEVAKEIKEPASTIRFWCIKFKDILYIKRSGTHRKFTQHNINQLLTIKKLLREKHYSVEQVIEFSNKPNIDEISTDIEQNDPVTLQIFSTIIANEVERQLSAYKDTTISTLKNEFIDVIIPKLQSVMVSTVNDTLSEKLNMIDNTIEKQNELQIQNKEDLKKYINEAVNNNLKEIKLTLDDKEANSDKKDLELTELLKKILQERTEEYEKSKKKSLFARIFHKDRS